MASKSISGSSKASRAEVAVRLAQIGDLEAARDAFASAVANDRRNPDLLLNFAILEEQRGEIDHAAERLTHALELRPDFTLAATRLSRLLARYQVSDLASLSVGGLKAALLNTEIAHQPVVDVSLLKISAGSPTVQGGIERIEAGTEPERSAGAKLIERGSINGFAAELLLLCLSRGIVKQAAMERLLTGVRAALLLDCPADRIPERPLMALSTALMIQGWSNDHAWAETEAETTALSQLTVEREKLLHGDLDTSRRFLMHALYRPLTEIVDPPLLPAEALRLKPRALRDAIAPQIATIERQRDLASKIPRLMPMNDETSRRVAGQYEAAPYPRWTSLQKSKPGALKAALSRHFNAQQLAFMDRPYNVLIAGCGTGQQALQSATAYGPNAKILALDLSATSLSYAVDMANRHGIGNVEFMQGDILDASRLERTFDVIECVGVLHHMADWRLGWKRLIDLLEPSGIMYLGFYSTVSRAELMGLRADPAFPGPGCTNTAARTYRRNLLMRTDGTAGAGLKVSRDFYSLNAFRDLVLHESEQHLNLADIAAYLDEHGLQFQGFTLESQIQQEFATSYPSSPWPGALADWASYERRHPRVFDAMYRFWTGRRN